MRTRRRTLPGAAILAVWAAAVGWQVRREYFQPELARLAEAALALNPGVTFYTLTMGDRAVGQATSRLDTVPDGFRLEDFMALELPALGQRGTAVVRTAVGLSPSLVMRDFSFSLDSEVGRYQVRGVLRPDSVLRVDIDSGDGDTRTVDYRLASPPIFSSVVPIRVAMGGELEVGRSFRLPAFDPSSLSTRPVEVRILERDTMIVPDSAALNHATGRFEAAHFDTVAVWRIAEVLGGVSVESWIDEDGRVVEASSPLGFSMRRTEYELARQALEDARGGGGASPVDEDVILSTAIRSDVAIDDLEARDELRFVLSGVELAGFDLEGGRQSLRGDTLVVRREDWNALDPDYRLPYKSMDLRAELRAEPLVQSDDDRIVEAARRAAGGRRSRSRDPRGVAARLTGWVHDRLAKEVTFSVPSAVDVLEAGRGDCNEHTVLYVALARSLGLPARTAVGLVYLDGSFFYHAWPEVWLGRWVAVDPTFGQWPADAAHIRFVVGGLAEQVEIVRLIGHLDIDVVPASVEDR